MLKLTIATPGGLRCLQRHIEYPEIKRLLAFYETAIVEYGDGTVMGNGVGYLILPQAEIAAEAELDGNDWRRDCLASFALHWLHKSAVPAHGRNAMAKMRTADVTVTGSVIEGEKLPLTIEALVNIEGVAEPVALPALDRLDIWTAAPTRLGRLRRRSIGEF